MKHVGRREDDAVHWLIELHTSLFAGGPGTWVTGLSAVALALLSLSGLSLWFPRGGWAVHYFAVKRLEWRGRWHTERRHGWCGLYERERITRRSRWQRRRWWRRRER